jgi:hypothetical protein
MLTVSRISRLAALGRFDHLLDELIRNGRPLPVAARARLAEGRSAALTAVSLGAQRALELAYAPDSTLTGLLQQLVDLTAVTLRDAEALPAANRPGPVALATAARALCDLLDTGEARGWALVRGELGDRARDTLAGVAYALFVTQAGRAARVPREAGLVGDGLDSALVLWQLGGDDRLAGRLNPPLEISRLAEAADRAGLWRQPDCAAVLALVGRPLVGVGGEGVPARAA